MLAYYAHVRSVHVAAVLLSGALFMTRGLLVHAGRPRWAMAPPVRYASYSIDTVLLTAALMLVTMVPGTMFANHWLTAKVTLLVVYVVLGIFALKRTGTARWRVVCFIAALAVYVVMLGIASAHHPLGWLVILRRAGAGIGVP